MLLAVAAPRNRTLEGMSHDRRFAMRDSKFTKILAAAALAVAALYVTTPLWAPGGSAAAPQVHAYGGGVNGVIAYAATVGTQEKLFLVDTQGKVILVYAASNGGKSFNLCGGRNFSFDAKASAAVAQKRGSDIPYRPQGYSVQDMMNLSR